MTENRDLDGIIAEEIYGYKETQIGPDYDGKNECTILTPNGKLPKGIELPPKGIIHRSYFCPEFTSDWVTVMGLAKHVKLDVPVYALPMDPKKIAEMCIAHYHTFGGKNDKVNSVS